MGHSWNKQGIVGVLSVSALSLLPATAWAQSGGSCGEGCSELVPPPVTCESGCTRNVSGSAGVNVNPGEVVCVQPESVLSGGVNMNGGELRICGSASPAYFNLNGGNVTVLGQAAFANLNANSPASTLSNYGVLTVGNLSFRGAFENYGSASVSSDLNVDAGASLFNAGELALARSLNNGGVVSNAGTLDVGGALRNNGNGSLSNSCEASVQGNVDLGGPASNTGVLSSGGTVTVNRPLSLGNSSTLATNALVVNARIDGPGESCSSLSIATTTILNGSAVVTGLVDICDPNGIETNNGTLSGGVTTDCSCVIGCEEPAPEPEPEPGPPAPEPEPEPLVE
ncbi:MAG: hypothetical protein DIU78_003310 [Pseudomonadota bacterium]